MAVRKTRRRKRWPTRVAKRAYDLENDLQVLRQQVEHIKTLNSTLTYLDAQGNVIRESPLHGARIRLVFRPMTDEERVAIRNAHRSRSVDVTSE